ncbi:hypothetical protein [Streptomyces sp. NPDC047315]|uniref:hypothetical protein n=1 Tax=Streptomyces sp. NPDC047315 TaxID=3155142 RepID=UPI003407D327
MRKVGTRFSAELQELDPDALRAAAERAVMEELAPIARPDERLERAAEIIHQADAEIALHVQERDEAVASLWFYDHVLGIPAKAGIKPNAYREILSRVFYGGIERVPTESGRIPLRPIPDLPLPELAEAAREAGVPVVKDAAKKLPRLATVVIEARARRAAAVVFMRNAALALSEEPYNWNAPRIAAVAGVSRKLISQQQITARRERDAKN